MSGIVAIDAELNSTGDLGLPGLRFAPNTVSATRAPQWTRVVSNTGYVVGHFVTHAPTFSYGDKIGYHVGQVDQLTFMSDISRSITALLIDCRAGSPAFGTRVELAFATSPRRKLIVPAGVAHTFRDIGKVVTRNDLLLYCSTSNQKWRVEDDLVSLPLDVEPSDIEPQVVNDTQLPLPAAVLFYRLQAKLLRGGRDAEFAKEGGASATPSGIHPASDTPPDPPAEEGQLGGVQMKPNSYFPVAPSSWGIVPSTPSCVMDMCVVEGSDFASPYLIHQRHDVLHTFLDRTGEHIGLDVIDTRRSPASVTSYELTCDERYHVLIPAGHGYRYRGEGRYLVRVETDIPSTDSRDNFSIHDSDTHAFVFRPSGAKTA